MMDQAADAGVGNGIGISLRGDGSELVGVGIARSSLPGSRRNKPQDYLRQHIITPASMRAPYQKR